ncbi:hypothetical protein V1477_000675 [Vespula maculifrons]|uniref:Uncharacterized protein n=1 Tax=Vespula maculifrons TaxID=7453 RepID=A0ABD2D2F8_VESMC
MKRIRERNFHEILPTPFKKTFENIEGRVAFIASNISTIFEAFVASNSFGIVKMIPRLAKLLMQFDCN